MPALLRFEDVSVVFENDVRVLDKVSFAVQEGETRIILGAAGSTGFLGSLLADMLKIQLHLNIPWWLLALAATAPIGTTVENGGLYGCGFAVGSWASNDPPSPQLQMFPACNEATPPAGRWISYIVTESGEPSGCATSRMPWL